MRLRLGFGQRFTLLLIAAMLIAGVSLAGAQEVARSYRVAKGPELKVERMLLLLAPTAEQQADLDTLLKAQQTAGNAQFHGWLTSAQFTARFAPSMKNATAVSNWLQSVGFQVAKLPASRGWVEFSGTGLQVEEAFGSQLKGFDSPVSGRPRVMLSKSARFPDSIAPVVKGLVSLDGTEAIVSMTPISTLNSKVEVLKAESSIDKSEAITPALLREAIDLTPIAGAAEDGRGETIALPSRSNVQTDDIEAFRHSFGLPQPDLAIELYGVDPGRTGEEAAMTAAISWAGVTAPEARMLLVPVASTNATDGLDLALAATIDRRLADVVSIGYSSCESALNAAHQAFYAALFRQASAEGISIVAATGDSGAAACHLPTDQEGISSGLEVNALASTPWNTAIGAVAFMPNAAGNLKNSVSAWLSNDSASSRYATGGGFSKTYSTPGWQAAAGVPASDADTDASHHRYLPDLGLPVAATRSRGLAFCFSGDSGVSGCRLVHSEGSAASSAIFAGIAAVLAQKYGPQGNLAPNLYALERHDTSVNAKSTASEPKFSGLSNSDAGSATFVDVVQGSAKMLCIPGTVDCDTGLIGFDAKQGYDLASGLGSVNAGALIANWATPEDIGTSPVTVEMKTVGGSTYNPSATISLAAKVISGSGGTVPTGTVQFYDETVGGNTGSPVTLSATGTATYSETGEFTDGSHSIAAIYSGDTTYETAESEPITFDIQASATSLTVTPSTTTPEGGSKITVTGVITSTNPGATAPTGLLTVNLDGIAQGTGTFKTTGTTTSATVSVTIPASGSHAIQGTYAGDTNYESSTSPSVTVSVTKVATVTTLTASPTTITTGVMETLTAAVGPATPVTGTAYTLTGTVSFYDGATLLGTVTVASDTAVLTGVSLSASTSHSLTAVYSGDATYSTSTSTAVTLTSNLLPVTVTLSESTMILSPGQAVTLNAVVTPVNTPAATVEQHPSGYILFYAGTVLIGTQAPVLEGSGYSSIASTFVSSLAAGNYVITAMYSGDPTYAPATSNSLNLEVEDFILTCSSTNITMVQGTTQSVPCSVAALGGLTGSIQVVCEEQNPPTTGAISCSFNPTVLSNGGATNLTVITTAGNIAENRPKQRPGLRGNSPPWGAAGGGLALAFAGLLFSPVGRRAKWLKNSKLMALTLLLVGLASAGLGCNNSATLVTNTGTPLGEHTLKLTAASVVGTVTVSHYAYLTVNVTPPTQN